MGSVKHRCGQSPAGHDPVDPRPGPAPADCRADPVPDESWAEYRLVIRSGEYEFCSEWTRDYDTVIGWDNDSPPDWIVERRGVSVTPPQRPMTAGPEMVLVSADDLRLALGDVRTTNAPQPGDIPEGWSDARSRLRAAVRVEEGGELS